ncbi:tRNA pseudouridine(55) synthase TruB [Baaleninema simplex]|uniref:tRNA pseudouridine(55) synthase TruB n=1 Tax=Baaleninema simplex TaxID=2862350 RepID=UPI00034CB0A0|nr:tRNA pseudouridine(55) synthase TruB [Baaleninema simplex]
MTDTKSLAGFLNLDKPQGWTSHDCVAKVRRLLKLKKVGHGGTLDPMATGVLPIAVGKATRLIQYLPSGKAYNATVRFGVRTTTDDLEGETISVKPNSGVTLESVRQAIPQFIGSIAQIPPKYSAIQVDGKRLYDLARAGEDVEVPSRQVEISSIDILDWRNGEFPEVDLAIACGGGTYIRAIARDLGEVLGSGATLAQLLRTHSSGFSIAESWTIDRLAETVENNELQLFPPESALKHLPSLSLPETLAQRWRQGQRLQLDDVQPGSEFVAVFDEMGTFLGVGTWKPNQALPVLAPKMVFDR